MLANDTCRIITAQFRRSYSDESVMLALCTAAAIRIAHFVKCPNLAFVTRRVALLAHFQVLGLGFGFSVAFLVPDFGRTLHCASNFAASWHVTFSVSYWKELKVHKSIRWDWLDITNNINNLLIFCISYWDCISAVECSMCITTVEECALLLWVHCCCCLRLPCLPQLPLLVQ